MLSRMDRPGRSGFGIETCVGIDDSRAQRNVIERTHHRQGAVRAFTPIVVTERDTCIVETHPCARDQLRMHQDEPAVRVVLGRPRLAGDVGVNPESCPDALAGTPVDDVAHHLDERLRRTGG